MTSVADPLMERAVRRATVQATLAPSIHNTQPWRFKSDEVSLEVHADWSRHLRVLDPRGRQLLISCGCAVFNAKVAFAASGFESNVAYFPDPAQPSLLVRLTPSKADNAELPLSNLDAVVELRRTNRRDFTDAATPDDLVRALVRVAEEECAELVHITLARHRSAVVRLSKQAEQLESLDLAYRAELQAWAGSDASRSRTGSDASACWLLLGTRQDTPQAWLRAGEALEHVLLEIARRGYAASPLTQLIEVAATNGLLRQELELKMYPHMLLRVGRAPTTPSARRRRLVDMFEESR